jgi:hypothetical protein
LLEQHGFVLSVSAEAAQAAVDQREAKRREMAQPSPTDPIKRGLSNRATLAGRAQEILRYRFAAADPSSLEHVRARSPNFMLLRNRLPPCFVFDVCMAVTSS